MIDLARHADGTPLCIGHRGAAALAPENTLDAFRAAVAAGVDLIEFDVVSLPRGPLLVAHSLHLDELTHGAARGSASSLDHAALRALAPGVPTLDEALTYFRDDAPAVGLHVDLKLDARLDELAAAITGAGLAGRTVVTSTQARSLLTIRRENAEIRTGITYPHDRLGVSRRPRAWPVVALGLNAMRASVPARLPRLLRRSGATAVMLQHRLVTDAAVSTARSLGVPVIAWTVDDPEDVARVARAGVDGVVTNDPVTTLATLRS